MIEIIPSLLVESRNEFEKKLRLIENEVTTIHVDVLDGSLFDNTTWFDAKSVGAMRTNVKYELHLMVNNPLPIIKSWKKYVETLFRAVIHAEIERPMGVVLSQIKEYLQLETGVAIDPETPLNAIESVLHSIDQLTIMGVHPGYSGQKFNGEHIYNKIIQAKKHCPNLPIEIDGGVTKETLNRIIKSGATRICTASLIFRNPDPLLKLRSLKNMIY